MFTFDFTDRTSYLAYRANWKKEYNAISEAIRLTKWQIGEAYEAGNKNKASSLQSALHYQRQKANQMMQELAEAKQQAMVQHAARKAWGAAA